MTLTLTARPDRTQQWTFDLPAPNTPGAGGWRNAPGAGTWRSLPQWFKSQGYYTAGAGIAIGSRVICAPLCVFA
jgi:hypothetical protein